MVSLVWEFLIRHYNWARHEKKKERFELFFSHTKTEAMQLERKCQKYTINKLRKCIHSVLLSKWKRGIRKTSDPCYRTMSMVVTHQCGLFLAANIVTTSQKWGKIRWTKKTQLSVRQWRYSGVFFTAKRVLQKWVGQSSWAGSSRLKKRRNSSTPSVICVGTDRHDEPLRVGLPRLHPATCGRRAAATRAQGTVERRGRGQRSTAVQQPQQQQHRRWRDAQRRRPFGAAPGRPPSAPRRPPRCPRLRRPRRRRPSGRRRTQQRRLPDRRGELPSRPASHLVDARTVGPQRRRAQQRRLRRHQSDPREWLSQVAYLILIDASPTHFCAEYLTSKVQVSPNNVRNLYQRQRESYLIEPNLRIVVP